MNSPFSVRHQQDALILSFSLPARTLSWAVLNGGFCHARHVINHHVDGNDALFCAQPGPWLERAAAALGLRGKIVAMATAVQMRHAVQVSMESSGARVVCFATVGCGNALSVGDPATVTTEQPVAALHTINMILTVEPGLADEAMVEAVQIATEGRVRALYEKGIKSCQSGLPATGTGTDCVAVVSLGDGVDLYCGKHTKLGELIGSAAYKCVAKGLALSTGQ
ncbi:MAG TPA: adenosylcobinamide amidohydrolase [Candidatus Binatia bacterium]